MKKNKKTVQRPVPLFAFTMLPSTTRGVRSTNDLAKELAHLSLDEQCVLAYLLSAIKEDTSPPFIFSTTLSNLAKSFGLTQDRAVSKMLGTTLVNLQMHSNLYFSIMSHDDYVLKGTNLLPYVTINDYGAIKFCFCKEAAPYLFELKERYYTLSTILTAKQYKNNERSKQGVKKRLT